MYINITDSEKGNNKGSSGQLVHYLDKENRLYKAEEPMFWFNCGSKAVESYEVKNKLDNNIAKLCRDDAKFFIKVDEFVFPRYVNNLFEFSALEEHIEDAILYEEYHGNKQIRDYCSSLITRYKSLKEREEFLFLTTNVDNVDKDTFIDELLGINPDKSKKNQISIIDLNSVEDEIVEVISCVISRMIFEKLKKIEPRNSFPVNIVLEEAHRYISNNPISVFGSANKIFERIAKEGRKYGMFLLASSQRPSELSRTVLSQCSNFIIHRIQNPEDLSQIRQMTPHISASILSRLPSIPRQHALVFGHAVQIPTLFKVNEANPTPHSNDNDVTKNWFVPKLNEIEDLTSQTPVTTELLNEEKIVDSPPVTGINSEF